MIDIKPQFLNRDGEATFVVLTLEEYEAIREALEDAEDLRLLRESREGQADDATISHDEVKTSLGL